jgi:hypothetical protein
MLIFYHDFTFLVVGTPAAVRPAQPKRIVAPTTQPRSALADPEGWSATARGTATSAIRAQSCESAVLDALAGAITAHRRLLGQIIAALDARCHASQREHT